MQSNITHCAALTVQLPTKKFGDQIFSSRLVPVQDDAMEPTIRNGGFAMIRPIDQIRHDAVYALDRAGVVVIRRAQVYPGSASVRLFFDNTLYGSGEMLTLAEADDMVIGRVVGACNPV